MILGEAVPIEMTYGGERIVHHLRPFASQEYLDFVRDTQGNPKIKQRGRNVEVQDNPDDKAEAKLEWWKKLIEKVEGIEIKQDGQLVNIMTMPDWKEQLAEKATRLCIAALDELDTVYFSVEATRPFPASK